MHILAVFHLSLQHFERILDIKEYPDEFEKTLHFFLPLNISQLLDTLLAECSQYLYKITSQQYLADHLSCQNYQHVP